MELKLGKLDAIRPATLSTLAVYANGKLSKPPTSVGPPSVSWGMDLNDQFGICTLAGVDHLIGAFNTVLGTSDPRPGLDVLKSTYFSLTGGADSGLVETDVLSTWRNSGLFGNKIAAYAPVNHRSLLEIHQAVAFYRGAYLGIQCPQSAQEDFSNGRPWTYDPTSPVEGGHCIIAVGYTPTSLLCVSWGALCEVTYPFLAAYLDEAWVVIAQEMVEKGGDGLGLNLATLNADLNLLRR